MGIDGDAAVHYVQIMTIDADIGGVLDISRRLPRCEADFQSVKLSVPATNVVTE